MNSYNAQRLSLVSGPPTPKLCEEKLGDLIDERAQRHGDRTAVVVPWQSRRLSYNNLASQSRSVAKALLGYGLRQGDCIGIMAGNCAEYLELFLGSARIGCPAVVMNNHFSPDELLRAVSKVSCKALFIAAKVGTRSLADHICKVKDQSSFAKRQQCHVVEIGNSTPTDLGVETYNDFVDKRSAYSSDEELTDREARVMSSDILNLQFTSGTTGHPKAAALTHRNLINNAMLVGVAMQLSTADVVCCPPPLFHCFGLVLGFMASFWHGSTVVFPSDAFNADQTIAAVVAEHATALLGVPTMFLAELEALKATKHRIASIRTGLAAGAPIPASLMARLREEMGIKGMLIGYGMTETSPLTFLTSLDDSREKMFGSIGRVLPHTSAKIIDAKGEIVPIGVSGQICTSGYALQTGYWEDEAKTREVMVKDSDGVLWMHTGDEGYIDSEGYGHITGRIKDLIIRGGENISPSVIEECILENPSVSECCAVGIEDDKYGEDIGVFLKATKFGDRLADTALRSWVSAKMGRSRAPKHIFWLGDAHVVDELPKTGSGKYQKHLVRRLGNELVKNQRARYGAKL